MKLSGVFRARGGASSDIRASAPARGANVIRTADLTKTYTADGVEVHALQSVSLDAEAGAFIAFIGPSGSGKTTLLNLLGCLDKPTRGRLEVAGTDVTRLDRRHAAAFRGAHIGFVFQSFNLVPVLTAFENVEYPLVMVQDRPASERRPRVLELLDAVGMANQRDKRPEQLSGGQKQRVAIARALVTRPELVLADEPTANLDSATAYTIIALMKKMRDEVGTTFLFATHVVIPELTYSPVTNLELRFRAVALVGERRTEYGEKPNDYRLELRVRYYF